MVHYFKTIVVYYKLLLALFDSVKAYVNHHTLQTIQMECVGSTYWPFVDTVALYSHCK